MRSERLTATALAGALLLAAGCSDPESFIVLTLRAPVTTPPTTIAGVDNIRVRVSKGTTELGVFIYAAHGATIGQGDDNTLSVGFSRTETGNIDFVVDAMKDATCSIGRGTTTKQIKKGGTAFADVTLAPGMSCSVVDGGTDAPEGGTLPGCDPVNPQSTAASVTTCTATQTCQVDCMPPMNAPPRTECIAGGTGAAGAACNTNADCQPGTQCFNYTNLGCAVKVCLRFCNGDAECTSFGAGGGGPGSVCQGPVMCPTFLTAYRTCTFNCDPRAMAAGSRGGCPNLLACVMPADMDQVDCSCPEATRTKGDGQPCASAAECAPGFICNRMSGTQTCRPICRCDANASGVCTTTANDCPTAGTTCRAVTNNTIYGICL